MRAEARGEGPPAGRSGAAGAGSGAAASGPPVGGPPCGRILRLAATGQGGYRDFHGTEKQGGDKKSVQSTSGTEKWNASQPAVDRFDGRIGGAQPCRMVG